MTNNESKCRKTIDLKRFPHMSISDTEMCIIAHRTAVIVGHINIQVIGGKIPTTLYHRVATVFTALMSCKRVTSQYMHAL